MDGPTGRPSDDPPNSDRLGVYHRTVHMLKVKVDWRPAPHSWQQLGLDLDPDPMWRSGNIANTNQEYRWKWEAYWLMKLLQHYTYTASVTQTSCRSISFLSIEFCSYATLALCRPYDWISHCRERLPDGELPYALFDIHRVHYRNGLKSFMKYLTMVHSACVVKSGK